MPRSAPSRRTSSRSTGSAPRKRWTGCFKVPSADSIRREAVEQAGAAGLRQVLLAAAARGVRGVPRFRRRIVLEADPVVMADERLAGAGVAGPVLARHAGRDRAVGVRAGQDVVLVRSVAASVDHGALFG